MAFLHSSQLNYSSAKGASDLHCSLPSVVERTQTSWDFIFSLVIGLRIDTIIM